ncbi:MAG: leucine-rich repeat domain-containing protein, partial [Clostridia bacterium]|nr:leucine-rich repeat domain-containing protein [Clostridia bacterium]
MFRKIISLILSIIMFITGISFTDFFPTDIDKTQGIIPETELIESERDEDFAVKEATDGNWIDYANAVTADSSNVYSITTEAQLAYIAKIVNEGNNLSGYTVRLMNDLDLGGREWTPIGEGETEVNFRGVFDGNNHTIANLTINSDTYGVGLIGLSYNTTIKNVGIISPKVTSTVTSKVNVSSNENETWGVGALVGFARQTTFSNCFVRDGYVRSLYRVGGLIGNVSEGVSSFTNCYVQGTVVQSSVDGGNSFAGGLIGVVTANADTVGGTTLSYCYSTATVNGGYPSQCGSLFGATNDTDTSIVSCYGTTNLYGTLKTPVKDSNSKVVTSETLKILSSSNINGGNGYTADTGTLLNDGYPRFSWEIGWINTAKTVTADSNNVYSITTPSELAYIAQLVNSGNKLSGYTVKLMNDLDLSRYIWSPIGGNGSTTTFRGTFDGNGHVISGLKIHSSTFGVGLFGFSIQATFKNVGIISPDVYTTYSEDATTRAYGAGALSGSGIGITVENCFVRGGSVTAYYRAAALVSNIMSEEAWQIGSSFSNCYVQGTTVTSTGSTVNSIVGGLTSLISIDTVFNNCYSTAKCSSGRKQSVGSVIGGIAVSTVVNFNDVYATETMSGIYNNVERAPVCTNSEIVTATKLKNLDRTTLNTSNAFKEDTENKNEGYPVLLWEASTWADKAVTVTADSNKVYSITTESELAYIAKLVRGGNTLSGYTVKLMNDLDLGGYEWTPIGGGGTTVRFKGTFDGNNHTIAGLKITSDKYGIGLFGLAENATIKNVGLIEPDVSNTYSSVTESDKFSHGTAALLGYGMGVTVQGCFIREGSVTSAYRAGGIIGNISSTASTITNCYVQGTTVTSTGTANTAYAGGIAGVITVATTFNYCYSTAKCTSGYSNHAGSVLGATTQTSTALNSCYGTTTIHGKYNGSTSPKTDSYSSVVTEGTLKVLSSTNINGGNGYVTDTGILLNDGYPRFSWEIGWASKTAAPTLSGTTYSIYKPEELAHIAKLVNGGNNLSGYTVKLMNDIDLSRYIWTPIGGGGTTKQFVGIFDGNSHTISGLKTNATTSAIGLFGISTGGIFKNVGIIEPTVSNTYTTSPAGYTSHGTGILLGYGMGVTVENCFVREGSISSAYRTGGIIGNISSSESFINNCYVQGTTVTSTGTTNSAYAGGLIGVVTAKTNFNFCYSTATVTSGYNFVGSICGTTTVNTTSTYCVYATGKLFGGSVTPQYPISSKIVTEEELKDLTKTNLNNDNAFVSDNMIDNDVNDDFPRLLWEVEWVGPETSKPKSDGNTYYIYNAKELAWVSEQVSFGFTFSGSTVKLMDNIDLASYDWIPIGGRDYCGNSSFGMYFGGIFDGNNKKVSNIYIDDNKCYSGLFGCTKGATIKNTGVINPYINSTMTGGGASFSIGGLIGRAMSTVTDRCYVRGGTVSSSGLLSVGGLIGATITTACTTTNSYVQGTTVKTTRVHNDSSAGGIIGCAYLAADVVENCYSTAVVTTSSSKDNAGAIVGRSGGAVHITNCYGAGDIGSAADSILAGYNASSYSGNVSAECAIVPSDTLRTYAKKLNVQAFAEDHKKINNGFPVHISEYDVVYEEYFYYTVSNNQATITGVKPILKGEITIPETLGGNKVIAIADRAFSGNDTITSVRISDSIISIGEHAFYNCGEIVSISIPASVKEIGLQAFYRCDSLNNLYIEDLAAWCSIEFEDYYTNPLYYAENLYLNRTLVTALEIPSAVTSIGDYAFYGCDSIITAVVGNSVKTIGRGAFGDCGELARADIGTGVTSISADTFNNCPNLKNIFVDAGNNAYSSSNGVLFDETRTTLVKYPEGKIETAYSIPNTVVTVGEYAFSNADNILTLTIGTNVKFISDYAFYDCDNLTAVTMNSKVETIGNSAFENCNLITGITLPDVLTTVGDHAFSDCMSITTLETGDAITTVDAYAFNGCTGLTAIDFGRSVVEFFGDGVFNDCSALADVITPYGTESIGMYTFHGCTALAWVAMPDTLTSIDYRAFAECNTLEMIHFI